MKSGMEHFIGLPVVNPVPESDPGCSAEQAAAQLCGTLILWYRRDTYGVEREYVHPSQRFVGESIMRLTGMRTINASVRAELTKLSGGYIQWKETVAP